MKKISDVINMANKAGYRTYLQSTKEPQSLYGGGTTRRIYVLAGDSWETPWELPEDELEKEYNVFSEIAEKKAK